MENLFNEYLNSMILSASGWRMIFVQDGDENNPKPEIGLEKTAISAFIGKTFADYINNKIDNLSVQTNHPPIIAVGMDTRPTGPAIADCILKVLLNEGIQVHFTGVCAAPEIMTYARSIDGFVYISASHNPIGHNGIKFGLNDGGVIPGQVASKLAHHFRTLCNIDHPETVAKSLMDDNKADIAAIYAKQKILKEEALQSYRDFTMQVITGETTKNKQIKAFEPIANGIKKFKFGIVADLNGSARTLSIDETFFEQQGLNFYPINNIAGKIVHAIIPEPENLVHCAAHMNLLQKQGKSDAILGYMPDCDGDRGNVVYWDSKTKTAKVLKAQEVFALSVLAELAYSTWKFENKKSSVTNTTKINSPKLAIAVNGPTSMRIDEIAKAFNTYVGRAEVGEANVVNRARELRKEGYEVRILGEGSNGGNITHPAAVRDPINTLFALIKLLCIRDTAKNTDKPFKKGLFHLWCKKSNQESSYKDDFTLTDIIETLPKYITTGVSEKRAILHIKTTNHSTLKSNFQKVFENEWSRKKTEIANKYGFYTYTAMTSNGTQVLENSTDFSVSGKGGLKIIFNDKAGLPIAFMWMRGSGTEPVFRILCDVKKNANKDTSKIEKELLAWETEMLEKADI
ncbi:MAG: phosphoglucomutase [Treponema sp. CETP13]|nr:MAG: phosphoglucomutase [Treponema sp. CETP13]